MQWVLYPHNKELLPDDSPEEQVRTGALRWRWGRGRPEALPAGNCQLVSSPEPFPAPGPPQA